MRDHHQLEIWHRSMDYAVRTYEFSAELPDEERYNLRSQLRRAATAVPLNIAEGAGCSPTRDFSRFLGYAYRSLKEVTTGIELCERLYRALPPAGVAALLGEGDQIARMVHAFRESLNDQR